MKSTFLLALITTLLLASSAQAFTISTDTIIIPNSTQTGNYSVNSSCY